ncbi:MAG: type II toxin-antitoxin system death-on-curing family toxin [Clostridiales bacterium]|nr:type II toxin-antitoxin system death-on-curing family toxin [Clostridiales bacterium]
MPVSEPRWVARVVADAIQTDMLLTHGGKPGLRDENLLESALARPRQLFSYTAGADIATLAAAYGYGLARNHPYNDGNKRVAFVVMAVFLGLNGLEFTASEADVVTTIVALASEEIEEDALADWIRLHTAEQSKESR